MKKVFSILLSAILALSAFGTVAHADGSTAEIRTSSTSSYTACDFTYSGGASYSLGYKIIDGTETVCVCGFENWPSDDTEIDLVIPSKVTYQNTEYTVTHIGASAFSAYGSKDPKRNCIKSVTFPSTLLSVGNNAFSYNYGLLYFDTDSRIGTLPPTLTSLGSGVFYSCESLAVDLVIPGNLDAISASCFENCYAILSIDIKSGVKEIGAKAFRNNTLPIKLDIPETATKINLSAFERMKGLKEIHFNHSSASNLTLDGTADTEKWRIPAAGNNGGCMGGNYCSSSYTSVYAVNYAVLDLLKDKFTAPIKVTDSSNAVNTAETEKCKTYFKENNFILQRSSGITVEKHDKAESKVECDFMINGEADKYSLGYRITDYTNKTATVCGFAVWPQSYEKIDLVIPSKVKYDNEYYTVKSIDSSAFAASGSSDAFKDCVVTVSLPDTLTSIGSDAFRYNYGLTSFNTDGQTGFLPKSLETLGSGAFYSCSNMEIGLVIPSSLKRISEGCFSACSKISSVKINSGVEQIDGTAFYNVTLPQKLVIPASVKKINLTAFGRMKGLREMYFKHAADSQLTLEGTADTDKWKYPEYPSIEKFGGCMGGSHSTDGYTNFYATSSGVTDALKAKILSSIQIVNSDNTVDSTETAKCRSYFEENNFHVVESIGELSITSPLSGSNLTSCPLTISGTATGGDTVVISVNNASVGEASVINGQWSKALTNFSDGSLLTISAVLLNNGAEIADDEVNVSSAISSNNTKNAKISKGLFYDNIKSVGGIDNADSLQLGAKSRFTVTADISDESDIYVIADAASDSVMGSEILIPLGTSSIDISFADEYDGSRTVGNILSVIKIPKGNSGECFDMSLSYSSVDTPNVFSSLYSWSEKNLSSKEAYYYLKLSDLADNSLNLSKLRLTVRWSGNADISLCEVDFNDLTDDTTVYAKKDLLKKKITVSSVFTDNMVIQRGEKIKIWGKGGADGEEVTATLNGKSASCTAANGRWCAVLDEMEAGGPYEITVSGSQHAPSDSITLTNIMIGEVWLASGQSNMAFTVSQLIGNAESSGDPRFEEMLADREVHSTDSYLRLFDVGKLSSAVPCDEVFTGEWKEAAPSSVGQFSATAYYFARKLREKLGNDVPIGIINASVGATGIEKWVSSDLIHYDSEYSVYCDGSESCHFNAMIHPLKNLSIKGVIWYQGESNVNAPDYYGKIFPQMIESWREFFKNDDMPFLFVNVAPYTVNSAELREAQLKALITVPNTAMAVITDEGDMEDIHPKYKKPVGERLALGAMALAYGDTAEYLGPVYKSMTVSNNTAILTFTHDDGLKSIDGDTLRGFEISDDGVNFTEATAEISDNRVYVYADGVSSPKAVRYGWKVDQRAPSDPIAATLCNSANLSAAPFRAADGGLGCISAVFTDSDGNEITDGTIPDNKTVKVKFVYTNKSIFGADIIAAVYDGDRLKNVHMSKAEFSYNGTNSYIDEFNLNDCENADIKIMVFKDMQSIEPLMEFKSLK